MDIGKIKNNLVISSNDLVHAKYDLTLWQKRVFVYAISQLEKNKTHFEPIRMNIKDIIKFFKASDGALAYNAIIEAPKSLDRTIEVPYISEKGFLRYGFVKLVQQYTIPADDKSENQYIEIEFNDALRPHLLELKEKFLKYDISNVIELQSTYSFRMYEILKSHEFQKSIQFDIEYLRSVLEVKNIYKSYKDFKRRIIDKAQLDLSKYCDITFTYEEKKGTKGKKIEAILFRIFRNDGSNTTAEKTKNKPSKAPNTEGGVGELTIVPNVPIETEKEKLILELSPIVVVKFGVSLKVFMTLMETHTEAAVRTAIQVTEKALQKSNISNVAGFFVEALRGQYQDNVEQKKQADTQKAADKKAQTQAAKQVEDNRQKAQEAYNRSESERKMGIIKRLIDADSELMYEATQQLKTGLIGRSYDHSKTLEQNIEFPMLAGALMNILQKLDPHIFD
jgi:plasmid replication initiation protein